MAIFLTTVQVEGPLEALVSSELASEGLHDLETFPPKKKNSKPHLIGILQGFRRLSFRVYKILRVDYYRQITCTSLRGLLTCGSKSPALFVPAWTFQLIWKVAQLAKHFAVAAAFKSCLADDLKSCSNSRFFRVLKWSYELDPTKSS